MVVTVSGIDLPPLCAVKSLVLSTEAASVVLRDAFRHSKGPFPALHLDRVALGGCWGALGFISSVVSKKRMLQAGEQQAYNL